MTQKPGPDPFPQLLRRPLFVREVIASANTFDVRAPLPYAGKERVGRPPVQVKHPPPGKRPGSTDNLQPWLSLGISRRTYYRRKKAGTLPSASATPAASPSNAPPQTQENGGGAGGTRNS